jgi:exonuclease SbcC
MKMPHRLRVRNYQSIEDAELEVEGFTVVVGPTNVGKSALVRAFKGLVENQGGNAFIRAGEVTTTVNLESDEGVSVEWRKGSDSGYVVTQDGETEEYTAVGKGQPEFIPPLGFGEIALGKIRERPQIGPQFPMTPFLLQKPGSFIAEAVSSVTGIDKVPPAIRAAEKDLRSQKADQKARKRELGEAETELETFAGLDSLQVAYDGVAASARQLQGFQGEVNGLRQLQGDLEEAHGQAAALKGVDEIEVPEIDALLSLRSAIADLGQMAEQVESASNAVKALKGVDEIEVPEFPADLVEDVQLVVGLSADLDKVRATLKSLESVGDIEVPSSYEVGTAFDELESTKTMLRELYQARDAVKGLQSELSDAEELYERLAEELAESMGDTCPLCGQELSDASHVHHAG